MKKTIDVIGKLCPIPVIETKNGLKNLKAGDTVEVHVDNLIATQNLSKMAQQMGLPVETKKINQNHYIVTFEVVNHLEESINIEDNINYKNDISKEKTVIVLASAKMGVGDEKLGTTLMKGFIYALTEQNQLPETILLYNSGCYLSTKDSESISDLKLLESQGVEILTCGTCLNYYGLEDKLEVGDVTNMYVIVEKQIEASKVIKP